MTGAPGSNRAHRYVPSGGLFEADQPNRTITSFFGERSVSDPEPCPDGTSLGPSVPQNTTVRPGDEDFATLGVAAGAAAVDVAVGVGEDVAVGLGGAIAVDGDSLRTAY